MGPLQRCSKTQFEEINLGNDTLTLRQIEFLWQYARGTWLLKRHAVINDCPLTIFSETIVLFGFISWQYAGTGLRCEKMYLETGEHANLLATYSIHIQRMRRLLAILVLVCCVCTRTRGHWKEHDAVCRYWCRTSDHRYYCCPSGKQENWFGHGWDAMFRPWLWIGAAAAGVVDQLPPFYSHWPEVSVTERVTEKHCPPLRTHCPRTYDWYTPPISCDADSDCSKSKKCCYDVCLEHKTCKLSE